jgi:hypothetical protein
VSWTESILVGCIVLLCAMAATYSTLYYELKAELIK